MKEFVWRIRLAACFRLMRQFHGWTDKEIAHRANVDLKTYRQIESGQLMPTLCDAVSIGASAELDGFDDLLASPTDSEIELVTDIAIFGYFRILLARYAQPDN